MNWMQRHDFWAWQAQDQFMLDETVWCCFRIAQVDLQAQIGDMLPNDDLRGEDDSPGPVLRWYGQLHGIPLVLDWHAFMPGGATAVLVHGDAPNARDRIRAQFSHWGERWEESAIDPA